MHERHVEPAVAQRAGHGDRVQLGDHQLERGMVAAQGDQRRGQQRLDGAGERPDPHRAGQPGARGGQPGVGRLQRGQHGLGVPDQGHPGGREADAPAGVLQQRHARIALQRGELLGDRGRRVGAGLRDRGDRAQVGQVAQQPQAADVKH